MRKIDKSNILSKEYKEWLDGLVDKEHPEYNSSKFKYYNDIKMSLLYCQDGLCAYTEQLLCEDKYISIDNWNDDKYIKELTEEDKHSIQGDLEHFDESLKSKKAWLWSNLFIVATHNNCRIKGTKAIKDILKPDSKNYDPYKYLDFDYETGIFTPNINLSKDEKEDVIYMIRILGLNCILNDRKKQLKDWIDMNELGLKVTPYRYLTAWDMTLKKLDN